MSANESATHTEIYVRAKPARRGTHAPTGPAQETVVPLLSRTLLGSQHLDPCDFGFRGLGLCGFGTCPVGDS